jgi:hypothetical protein
MTEAWPAWSSDDGLSGEQLIIEPATALRRLERYVSAADGLLSLSSDDEATRELERILESMEDLLGRLACEESIDLGVAGRLLSLRDTLSAQLSAAATLEEIELPRDAVVGVLRRAAESARAGIDELCSADGVFALRA